MTKQQLIKHATKWIEDIYDNAEHLKRTAYWAKKIDPGASEEVVLACITHDIERAFKKWRPPRSGQFEGWDNPVYLLWHSKRSAEFVSDFLKKRKASKKLIDEVTRLIEKHEIGGKVDENVVKDADSISFLEINAPIFISWIPTKLTKESVKKKFDYMFNRISSPKAKELARPFYTEALRKLEITP